MPRTPDKHASKAEELFTEAVGRADGQPMAARNDLAQAQVAALMSIAGSLAIIAASYEVTEPAPEPSPTPAQPATNPNAATAAKSK